MGQRGPPGGAPGQPARRRGARLGRLRRDRAPTRRIAAEEGRPNGRGTTARPSGQDIDAAPRQGRRSSATAGAAATASTAEAMRVPREHARPAPRDRHRNPQCRRRRHGPPPRAPGRSGRVGLRAPTSAIASRTRCGPSSPWPTRPPGSPPCASWPGWPPTAAAAGARRPRHLEAFGRLSDSAEHLPVLMDCQRALHKPKKVAALWASSGRARPIPTCWPRVGSWRRPRWPTRATSTAPSPCCRPRGRPRPCATRRSATSASGTCWPTCTSGPATSPRRASTSSGCSAPTPRPTTWRSASAASVPSAGPGRRDGTRAKTADLDARPGRPAAKELTPASRRYAG